MIAIMNFRPERVPELRQRIQEGRVELVNAFFLESTINVSGGEALVRLTAEGLRVSGLAPPFPFRNRSSSGTPWSPRKCRPHCTNIWTRKAILETRNDA